MRARARDVLLGAAVLVALGAAARAPAQTLPCEASAAVKEAFRNLPQSTGDAQTDRAAEVAALKALVKRFPNDVFVHQRYQDAAMYPDVKDRDAVIAEYRALAGKHPNDALYVYLAARAQVGSHTKDVIPVLEKQAPVTPSARLSLVRIYQSTAFKDAAKARAQIEAFSAACPSALSVYQYMRSLEASDFLKTGTERLRKLLQARTDVESFGSYRTLWALEFRVKPATEHDALRKQIAEDLTRLRTMEPGKGTNLYYTMQEGYDLVADKDGSKWAGNQIARVPGAGASAAESKWHKDNPYPKPTDLPEQRKAYYEALVKASADWVKAAPYEPYLWFDRVGALANIDKPSTADVEAAGEGLLKAIARNPGQMSFMSTIGGSSYALVVANLYAKSGVRLDRLPDLVAQGLPELEKSTRVGSWESDLYPSRPDDTASFEYARWYGRLTIADVWIKTKDANRARAALLDLQKLADASKPADAKDAKKQQMYLSHQSEYWGRMGDLARIDGHTTDAMTFYQNALLARGPQAPSSGQKDELGEKARALWTDIGGSNEGWQAWFGRRDLLGGAPLDGSAAAFTKMEKTLPDFDLADVAGARLRLADFKGKATLVGIWATW